MEEREIRILAIESSCDETAAAVVCNGRDVRSNIISTQIPLHTLYGGVVPEIASRKHMERINQVITAALSEADTTLDDLDAVAGNLRPRTGGGRFWWGWAEGEGDRLCPETAADRRAPYRRAYQRQLYRKQRSETAFFVPVDFRRPYPSW